MTVEGTDLATLVVVAPAVKVTIDIIKRNLELKGIWVNVAAIQVGLVTAALLPNVRIFPSTSHMVGNLIATGVVLGLGAGYLSDREQKPTNG